MAGVYDATGPADGQSRPERVAQADLEIARHEPEFRDGLGVDAQ